MPPTIRARGLTKRFGATVALDGLDLDAAPGRVTGLLGPNGSGKTTFVRTIATLLRPDAGELHVGGVDALADPNGVRRLIGLAGQSAAVDDLLTGRENLRLIARLFGHDRRASASAAGRVLELLDLVDAADRPVRTYSGGMRRRLDLGASLVGAPRLLLLDEPTTGLDPRSRNELWNVVRALVADGTDVLLTTQYLDEADQLAADIVIIDEGSVIARGTPEELKRAVGRDVIEARVHDPADVSHVGSVLAPLGVDDPHLDPPARRVTLTVADGTARLRDAVRLVDEHRLDVDDLGLRRPSLDEVFLSLTARSGGGG